MSTRRPDIQGDVMRWLTTGPADDTTTLANAVGADANLVAKAVRRLHDKGYVAYSFRQSPRGGRPMYASIHLTDDGMRNIPDPIPHAPVGKGYHMPSTRPNDPTDFRNHPSVAQASKPVRTVEVRTQPINITKVVPAPTPTSPTIQADGRISVPYPRLMGLRNRLAAVEPLRRAAQALPKDDPLRRNIEARIDNEVGTLSPIEQEYLAYANAHPNT